MCWQVCTVWSLTAFAKNINCLSRVAMLTHSHPSFQKLAMALHMSKGWALFLKSIPQTAGLEMFLGSLPSARVCRFKGTPKNGWCSF